MGRWVGGSVGGWEGRGHVPPVPPSGPYFVDGGTSYHLLILIVFSC